MEQPDGFITKGKENLVCKLERSLYSLKQAGRQWNNEIHRTLEKVDSNAHTQMPDFT
jgi:hypothetical protein